MISKSLVISTNLSKDIERIEECKSINFLLREMVRVQVQELCDNYNIDSDNVYVNYLPINTQMDYVQEYSVPLHDGVLEPIVKATSQYIHCTVLANRAGSTLSIELTHRTVINFNIVFLANGTIILTEEVFKL